MDDKPTTKPDSWVKQLRREIKAFHTLSGMGYTVIGSRALKNTRFWERMNAGGSITLAKADQLRAWLHEETLKLNPKGDDQ